MAEGLGYKTRQFFYLEKTYKSVNHGSFGVCPKLVFEDLKSWDLKMEQNPDRWFRYTLYGKLNEAREALAGYIGADAEDVVFVPNASTAVNSVLRSLIVKPQEKILHLNIVYPMVRNTLLYLKEKFGQELVEVPIVFPTSKEAIIDAVRKTLNQHSDIKLAIFCHITSMPTILLPVEELIGLCHSRNILVMCDGAHTIGQIPLNLKTLDPDFYLSNCHKWFFAPKGTAFLYVKKQHQPLIRPVVVNNWGFGQESEGSSPFQIAFAFEGTKDYNSFLTIPVCLKFRQQFGDQNIMNYNRTLARKAGELLAKMWNTELLVDPSLTVAMINVGLPFKDANLADLLPKLLVDRYNTYTAVFNVQGKYYTRVSAQIYNEIDDYKYLGNAVLELVKEFSHKL
jgi:selenocysteine lyase/cysteine desulfurase